MLSQNIQDIIVKVYHFFVPVEVRTWILGNMTRNARHELPKTLDFTDWLPIST